MIVFTLTMPNRNTWNGKWTGDNKIYAKTAPNKLVPKEIIGKEFYYSWDYGWTVCVTVEKMDYKEANKIMKRSEGFLSYDWMIESIIRFGEIKYKKDW